MPSPPPTSEPAKASSVSLFERTVQMVCSQYPLRLNFEDLTGVTRDIPELKLRDEFYIHGCSFCLRAKSVSASFQHCIRNKLATNRLARRRLAGFGGQCHLGLTDLVYPLVFAQRCLGVFYYGSVIVEGTEEEAQRRIANFCDRLKMDPAPYLLELKRVPRVSAGTLAQCRENLETLADIAAKLVEACGLPVDRYHTESGAQFMSNHRMPTLVQRAVHYIHQYYSEPVSLSTVAAHLKCNSDYLSRVLNFHLNVGFSEYLLRVRIDHARSLLRTDRYTVGEVGFMVGFNDHSYFGKIFKKRVGMTPIEYRGNWILADREKEGNTSTNTSPDHSLFRAI